MSYGIGPHDYDCDCWRCQSRRKTFAVECTAPAPQPAKECGSEYHDPNELPDSVELCELPKGHDGDHESATHWWIASQPADLLATRRAAAVKHLKAGNFGPYQIADEAEYEWQYHLSPDELIEIMTTFAAATPQVTPCDHFWRTIAVNPQWSWFTECEKCKIGAPLELQAENYVEGTSEQASPREFKPYMEDHEYYDPPQASPTPDSCPTCGSTSKNVYYAESNDASKRCDPIVGRSDSWHSSAATQKGTK